MSLPDIVSREERLAARRTDGLGSTTSFLDLPVLLGRQEDWEKPEGRTTGLGAPAGSAQVRYHDEYDN